MVRDYFRFGIDQMVNIFNEVEIWELEIMFDPRKKNPSNDPPHKVSKIQSVGELRDKLDTLKSIDELICIGIFSNMHTIRQLRIGNLVSKSDAQISTIAHSSLPVIEKSQTKCTREAQSKKSGFKIDRKRIEGFLVRKVLSLANLMSQINPRIVLMGKINRIWYSTSFREIPKVFIDNHTILKAVHHFDYDLILSERKNASIAEEQVVLIDSMGPTHPDYESGSYKDVPDFEAWRTEVLDALEVIEAQLDCRIRIAVHPRSTEILATRTYGGRSSVIGRTCSMVRNAPTVIILEGSTAVNFAVVFRRPILFVDSPIFEPRLRALNYELSHQLGMPLFKLDEQHSDILIPNVNENLYQKYQERHIKLPNTPEKNFWSVVASDYVKYFGSLDII